MKKKDRLKVCFEQALELLTDTSDRELDSLVHDGDYLIQLGNFLIKQGHSKQALSDIILSTDLPE